MEQLVERFDDVLPESGVPDERAVDELSANVDDGLVVTNGGRYFGFVEGGVLPAALAADWLTSTWDQNAAFHALSPAAAAVEEVCRRWLVDLLGLPASASVGFTSGAQMANLIGLAAARHHLLAQCGWDVERRGLSGAPTLTVLASQSRHATIDRALRLLGLGTSALSAVPTDDQGRMRPRELAQALDAHRGLDRPLLVCAQVGNVNSGACDPVGEISRMAHAAGAWVHVDGAFGLWAAAAPSLQHLVPGVGAADSWAVDAHKWLNVPYDSGIAFCAHPDAHRAAMTLSADYLTTTGHRDGADWTPESSRRARAFATWAALRSLGRTGIAEMVERSCRSARRFATNLSRLPGVEVLNDVVLNQVLVRVEDSDDTTGQVATLVQADGMTWLGTTVWRGRTALRISVSDHATREADVDTATAAIAQAVQAAR
ncbi:aminotransferase class V-fold PLP-dependent enzyme [Streptomyces smyrnaeus]|uniref:pyridoxal phosphate-dependent decarboxylase family protein n=1 Tax=Streptomyces smyrnaeus TaxID=1387713 RepID=UPI0033B182FD